MQRCITLALLGKGYTRTNPMVGCVIVHNNEIIAEGYHQKFGGSHAEVNAFNQIKDKAILKKCTVYVNLEPCSYHGKTPACASLFETFPCHSLVIGMEDPNPLVSGKGIARILETGCNVVIGILEKECLDLNKHFIANIEKKQPYVIGKWAQSADGFISKTNERTAISNEMVNTIAQQWRKENDAYLIGKNTLEIDNPLLNLRDFNGEQPIKCVIGNNIDTSLDFFKGNTPCYIFGSAKGQKLQEHIQVVQTTSPSEILNFLFQKDIGTLVIEGGANTLNQFIKEHLIDELRIIKNQDLNIGTGTLAPVYEENDYYLIKEDKYRNQSISYLELK